MVVTIQQPPQPKPLILLTSHNWQLTGDVVKASGAVNYIDDLYAKRNACGRDDFYQFRTDKSYTLDEGGSSCDPTAPQSYSNTWSFSNNDAELIVNLPAGSYARYQIRQLTSTALELVSTAVTDDATFVRTSIYVAI